MMWVIKMKNEEKIKEIINKLKPYLINDGGDIEFEPPGGGRDGEDVGEVQCAGSPFVAEKHDFLAFLCFKDVLFGR